MRRPTKHRALLFGRPLGPWRAHKGLALQDAIDAGEGSRDPEDGMSYTSVGVTIEEAPDEVTPDADELLSIQALDLLSTRGERASQYVNDQGARAKQEGRPEDAAHWKAVERRLQKIIDGASDRRSRRESRS